MNRLLCVLLLLTATACGGGGSATVPTGGLPQAIQATLLGAVSSTTSTVVPLDVANPFDQAAILDLTATTGPFALAPGQLPLQLVAREATSLDLLLTPTGPGPLDGSVVLRYTADDGAVQDESTAFAANAEAVSLAVFPSSLDFGAVGPGGSATRSLFVRNDSALSPAHVTSFAAPTIDFSLSTPALPITIAPGGTATLTVLYAPTAPGTPSGNLLLTTDDPTSPHAVGLGAVTGGEEITDLGTWTFDGAGNTAVMTFDVPADAISFMVEARTNAYSATGLRLLTGPNGEEFENEQLTGPYWWYPNNEVFTVQVPSSDQSALQLPAGGGTWSMRLMLYTGLDTSVDVRVIVERRPTSGSGAVGTLDLNVFLADGIAPTAATAANDSTLQTVLQQLDLILDQQGIDLGEISYYDIQDARYDDVSWSEFGPMLKLSAVAQEVRLNLFFVKNMPESSILGVAPMLSGPKLNGTPYSGVMSIYSANNPAFIGLVATHEIGHLLGLAHTQESDGSHDQIEDTDNCPSCTGAGGGYLMHWQAVGGTDITDGQGLVIRGHPLLGPAAVPSGNPLVQSPKPRPKPLSIGDVNAPKDWCGTCRRIHTPKGR